MEIETIAGIEYSRPQVTLLQESGLGVAEYAGRTAYDSFDKSEHSCITALNNLPTDSVQDYSKLLIEVNGIESSELLSSLAWVHHHHSVLELASLSFLIKGTSRGVLAEHTRHRHQSLTVRSTRYTMQNVLHAFNACSISLLDQAKHEFTKLIKKLNMYVVTGMAETIEIHNMYDKLHHQLLQVGNSTFAQLTMSKSAQDVYNNRSVYESSEDLYSSLCNSKTKRNVSDPFKWIVSDMVKVDMVVTFNLRSLKNYFELRNNGAAWHQIQWLSAEMIKATPRKYLDLILKQDKIEKTL